MKHDGSLDFSIDWAATMERLEAQMDKCVMESNDPASKIADFGVERRLRTPRPSDFKPAADSLETFKKLVFDSVRQRATGNRRVRGLMIIGKDVGAPMARSDFR